MNPTGMGVLQRPSSVGVPLTLHQLDRLGASLIGFGLGAAEVIESP
jgi:hypothetical protein